MITWPKGVPVMKPLKKPKFDPGKGRNGNLGY
jgi:hypothetical protein